MELFETEQLQRVERKLDEILALLNKPKRSNKKKAVVYSPAFEAAWKSYPKRQGSNPKDKAFVAWEARVKSRIWDTGMRVAVTRYAAYCDATGITGTNFVMQASRFFGPSHEWETDWSIPEKKTKLVVPNDDNSLVPWAKEHGFPEPGRTESYFDYRNRLRGLIREREA